MRTLEVWVPVDTKPEHLVAALEAHPTRWLPGPADDRGPGHYGVEVSAGPVQRKVTVAVGDAHSDGRNLTRRLIWVADPEPSEDAADEPVRALPHFDGGLQVVADGERRASLRIEGAYEPPAGPIGASMSPEQVAMLAEAVARFMLDGVAANIVEE